MIDLDKLLLESANRAVKSFKHKKNAREIPVKRCMSCGAEMARKVIKPICRKCRAKP